MFSFFGLVMKSTPPASSIYSRSN